MRLLLVGTNHRCADVRIREKLAITPQNVERAYGLFKERFPGAELVILSTCNRSELYVAKPSVHAPPSAEDLRQLLAQISGLSIAEVTTATIHREQEQAAVHLFRTAAGLDSRVLGEPQILGQMRRAYELAVSMQTVGSTTHNLFQQALATAKQLRTRTGIGTSRHSVGTVAIDFARQVFSGFEDKIILVLGAGEMIQTVMPHLRELGPRKLWIVNRTIANAEKLAKRFEIGELYTLTDGSSKSIPGGVRGVQDLDQLLLDADFIVSCTAAQEPVIGYDQLKRAAKKRRYRPVCMADLGIPRDIEPTCDSIRNAYLYNIDDLQAVIADNHEADQSIAGQCETEIQAAAQAVLSRVLHRDLGQLIRKLRTDLQTLGELEQDRTTQRLAGVDPQDTQAIEAVLAEHNHRLINKILHVPLRQLNQHDGQAPLGFYAAALRRLFNLSEAEAQSTAPHQPATLDTSEVTVADLEPPKCTQKP